MSTMPERLARIEALLESVTDSQSEMRKDVKAIRRDLDSDVKDMAALKNRGSGILVGVAIAAGGIGAGSAAAWKWLIAAIP